MEKVILGQYIGVKVPAELTEKARQDYVVRSIVEQSEVIVSEKSVKERAESMIEEYALRLNQQGLSIEQYFESAKTDEKALLKKMQAISKRQLEGRAVLEAIAKKQKIHVTEKEYDQEIEKLSIRYLMSKVEIKKVMKGREEMRLRNDIMIKKALDFVMDNIAEVEEAFAE